MKLEGFVLAGGRSRRMGVDKGRVPFPERRPMALFVADRLRPLCTRVRLVRRTLPETLPWPGIDVVRDAAPEGDAHALWGVAAALQACEAPYALVISCDRPWMETRALRRLRVEGGAVATDSEGRVQPLVACLPVSMAQAARQHASEGRSARSFVASLQRVTLPDAQLADLDSWDQSQALSPVQSLRGRLAFLQGPVLAVVERGERARLAALGAIDPHPIQSASDPEVAP